MAASSSPGTSFNSPEITLDDITETLSLVMTRESAAELVAQCLRDAEVEDIDSASSLQGFAEQLMHHGGFVKTVGSGLHRSAALRPESPRAA